MVKIFLLLLTKNTTEMANKHGRVKLASKEPHFPPKKKKNNTPKGEGSTKKKDLHKNPPFSISMTLLREKDQPKFRVPQITSLS